MVAEGVAALTVDGAEDRGWVVGINEGARPVINGLAAQGHIVGVENAVDKANAHPLGHEGRLPFDDRFEQGFSGFRVVGALREMALERVEGEGLEGLDITHGREQLKSADANVAGSNPREDCAGKSCFAEDRFAGQSDREAAGRRNAQRVHGLAHEVFSKHWAQCRATVTPARIGG